MLSEQTRDVERCGTDPIARAQRLKFVVSATLFELSLGLIAILAANMIGYDLSHFWSMLNGNMTLSIALGLVATLPLLAALVWIHDRTPAPLRPLRDILTDKLVPLFKPLSAVQLALLSFAAGVGEELLFRGLLQHGLAQWLGGTFGLMVGLVVASLIFGACHWLNAAYAIITLLVGLYFGLLLVVSGQLLVPIVTHGTYDFLALLYLTRYRTSP
jgi:membrane protease YdiL (CAAX protease family)